MGNDISSIVDTYKIPGFVLEMGLPGENWAMRQYMGLLASGKLGNNASALDLAKAFAAKVLSLPKEELDARRVAQVQELLRTQCPSIQYNRVEDVGLRQQLLQLEKWRNSLPEIRESIATSPEVARFEADMAVSRGSMFRSLRSVVGLSILLYGGKLLLRYTKLGQFEKDKQLAAKLRDRDATAWYKIVEKSGATLVPALSMSTHDMICGGVISLLTHGHGQGPAALCQGPSGQMISAVVFNRIDQTRDAMLARTSQVLVSLLGIPAIPEKSVVKKQKSSSKTMG